MLPPPTLRPGSSFPNGWDTSGTFLYIVLCVFMLVAGVFSNHTQASSYSLNNVVLLFATYAPMLIRYKLLPAADPAFPVSKLTILRWVCIAVAVAWGANLLYTISGLATYIIHTTGCPDVQDALVLFAQGDVETKVYLIFSAVIVAPIGEECCFRGFLYNTLKKKSGRICAAIVSSFFFAAVHMSLAQFLPLFVFALMLCYIYEKTQRLSANILAHAIFNAATIVIMLVM